VWRLDVVVWKECQVSWLESVGTGCNGEIYIISAGGHGVSEIIDEAAEGNHLIGAEKT
jgi:hypothetical protein